MLFYKPSVVAVVAKYSYFEAQTCDSMQFLMKQNKTKT